MSGNPKPKGREFNPHKAYAGTQTHRLVNGVFAVVVAVTLPLGYWYITRRAENSRFNQWTRGPAGFLDDSGYKTTQAAIQRIREAKQRRDDLYAPLPDKKCKGCNQVFIRPKDLADHQETCNKYKSRDGESSAASTTFSTTSRSSTERAALAEEDVNGKKPTKKYTFKPVASLGEGRKRKVEKTTPSQAKRRKSVESNSSVSRRCQSCQVTEKSAPSPATQMNSRKSSVGTRRRAPQISARSLTPEGRKRAVDDTNTSTRCSLRGRVQPPDDVPAVQPEEPKHKDKGRLTRKSRKTGDQEPKAKPFAASPSPCMEELVPETPEVKTSTLSSPVTRLKSKASSGALRREVEAMNACPSPQPSQTSSCPSKYDPFRSLGSLADGEHVEYMRALRVGDYMCRYIGSKDFADAVVRTDLRDIPVHKVVLASKYPQLSLNLLSQDVLDLSDVSYGHVSAWLKYVYTNDASALEVVPTEILGQIARFVSSGNLSKCNMSSSPVTSTPTIAKKTNMSAARKPSSTTNSSSGSHGIGQSSLATRGRQVDLVINLTDEKELANSIRLRDNYFCQPNKLPAVPSRNSHSKTGATAGKDRNKCNSLHQGTSPVIHGQTHDSRKLPSGTGNTSRNSGSTQKRNTPTPTIKISVAAIRSKEKSSVAAAPSPSLAAKISKKLRNRSATKVAENSSRSKPRRDGTSCAKGRNQSLNNEPNTKQNRGGKPFLRHSKGCTDDNANRDIDGNPQKQLTVSVLNLSHISTEFPTKLSDWTELLSPVRVSPSGDQNSAVSCGDSEIVALESDCGSTVRSASVASVPKENVEENCESNVAPDESVKDGSVSTQSVEDSKVSVDDVNSAKADNIGDSNVNNISGDRSEGVQGAKSTPSPVIKSRADQTDDSFASDINADAIKLLSQHCRLVDLTSDSADATAVVNLADEESSCSESIDVEIVDEYEGSTDTGEAVDVKGTSLAIDVSASSTLHHMSSTSCQEGETTAESHAAIEFHGSSLAPMRNVGGKDTKFHASMISSLGEELPSLSDMDFEPVDSVVCVPEEETALVSNKSGPEVMDSNMGDNSTLVADDSQLEMVGGQCGPADCRDSPSGSMSHPKMAGDGKRVQRGKSSPPEREMATPKRLRRTHRAYVPSPFTPMEDWHSHSDHTLKAKLRGFGLRDKMSRKRMISALTQIYVETHAYETDTSAEFTSLPTPDRRAELILSQPQANDNDVVSSEHQSVHVDVDLAVADDLKEKQAPQASDPNSGSRSDIDQLLGELDKLIESDEESPANRTRTFNSSSSEGEHSTDDESDSRVIGGGCDDATPKDIDTALRLMIKKNITLYDRILHYEMIPQEELVELVKGEGLKCSLAALRSFCFKQCIPVQNKQDQARRRKLPGVKKKPK